MQVNLKSIEKAAINLQGVAQKTPLVLSKRLSGKYGANIYLKREDQQEVRSFKIRGAYNKIKSLSDKELEFGVTCASAGNHAQGVAYSCNKRKVKGVIFMPIVTPNQKVEKVKKFGNGYVEIRLEGDTYDESKKKSNAYSKETGAVNIHAFDDKYVIAGQGTIGKEIYEQLDGKLDYALVAIGGGGMISGISTYLKEKNKKIKVIGVESDSQNSMYRSLKQGKRITMPSVDTFCDGTAVQTPGVNTFRIVQKNVDKVVLGSDGQVATDMIDLYQRDGIITEPAGALALSGLDIVKDKIKGKNVVIIICGGNNDILRYPEVLERSLVYKGLKHYFIINFAQKPGQLKLLLANVLGPNDDIVRFEYMKKSNKETGPALVGVELRNKVDYKPLKERMKKYGFQVEEITADNMLYGYLI